MSPERIEPQCCAKTQNKVLSNVCWEKQNSKISENWKYQFSWIHEKNSVLWNVQIDISNRLSSIRCHFYHFFCLSTSSKELSPFFVYFLPSLLKALFCLVFDRFYPTLNICLRFHWGIVPLFLYILQHLPNTRFRSMILFFLFTLYFALTFHCRAFLRVIWALLFNSHTSR